MYMQSEKILKGDIFSTDEFSDVGRLLSKFISEQNVSVLGFDTISKL